MKRIISVVLILALTAILSNVSVAASQAGSVQSAANLYEATGALAPTGSGEQAVTRGEFITYVMSALKFDLTPQDGKQFFSDVKANTVQNQALGYALAMGLVTPGECFYPDGSITYAQAVKILVTALGYGEEAAFSGGYPSGYLVMASRIDLSKYISISADNSICVDEFYILMRNFLEAELRLTERFSLKNGAAVSDYSQGGNILEHIYGWKAFKGIINGDGNTSLYDSSVTYEDSLLIDSSIYKCSLEYTLGMGVSGYSTEEDGSNTIVFMEESKNNKSVYIAASEIGGFSGNAITCYSEKGKTTSYPFEGLYSVIYNGKACFDNLSTLVSDIQTGGITLIDNDSDGRYDVCIIMDARIMNVGNVNDYNECMYDVISGSYIDYSVDSKIKVYQKGAAAYINSVKAGTVIEYYQSKDKGYTEIHILDNSVTGTLNGISDDTVFIDDKEYKFTDYFKTYNFSSVKIGNESTFALTDDGSIACVTEKKASAAVLGYTTGVKLASNLSLSMQMRIYNEMGKLLTLETAENVLVNETRPSSVKALFDSFNAAGEQAIRYTLNSEGKINKLYTENSLGVFDPAVDSENCLKRYNFDKYDTDTKIYYKSIGCFVPHFTISSKTKIIVVDEADAVPVEEERFSMGTLTTWVNDAFIESNRLQAYNVDASGWASVLIYKKNSSSVSISLNTSKFGFVSKVVKSLDAYGERAYKITICNNNIYNTFFVSEGSKLAKDFTDSNGNFKLGIGDGVRYNEGANSRLEAIVRDFDFDPVSPSMELLASRDNYPVNFYYGTVNAVSDTSLSIELLDSSTGAKGFPAAFVFVKAYVWLMDYEKQTISTVRPATIVSSLQSPGNGDKVVIRAYAGEVRDVLVIR